MAGQSVSVCDDHMTGEISTAALDSLLFESKDESDDFVIIDRSMIKQPDELINGCGNEDYTLDNFAFEESLPMDVAVDKETIDSINTFYESNDKLFSLITDIKTQLVLNATDKTEYRCELKEQNEFSDDEILAITKFMQNNAAQNDKPGYTSIQL